MLVALRGHNQKWVMSRPRESPPPTPPDDHVSRLIRGWRAERPDLPVDPLAVVYRVVRLAGHLAAEAERVFARHGVSHADFAVLAGLRRAGRTSSASASSWTPST